MSNDSNPQNHEVRTCYKIACGFPDGEILEYVTDAMSVI